jgi:hypothetical protein
MGESLTQTQGIETIRKAARELSFARFGLLAGLAFLCTWALLWLYILAFPMAYQDRDYPLAVAKETLLSQCLPDQVAVFGDSKAVAGVLPTAMTIPVQNFAFPAATPVETYFFVQRLVHTGKFRSSQPCRYPHGPRGCE